MSPPRPSGSALRPSPRATGVAFTVSGYEVVKVRLLIRLQERLDALKARRMPPALLAEASRQLVDQIVETEAARLPPADRARLAVEVAEEAFGFGPLQELFADPAVTEITVLGTQAILVKRGPNWLPSNAHFRDEDHLSEVLGKVRGQGEAVAAGLPDSVLDVRLPNGFRAVAVIPPAATGTPPLAAFVRAAAPPADVHPGFMATTTPAPGSSGAANQPAPASAGAATHAAARPPLGSGAYPAVRPAGETLTDRHRQRITERFTAKLAALGVFDLSGIDSHELRKVIAAYVDEYCKTERIFLTDTEKGRVTLEILTGMGR